MYMDIIKLLAVCNVTLISHLDCLEKVTSKENDLGINIKLQNYVITEHMT